MSKHTYNTRHNTESTKKSDTEYEAFQAISKGNFYQLAEISPPQNSQFQNENIPEASNPMLNRGDDDYEAEFKFFLPQDGYDLIPKHYADIFEVARRSGILHITQGNVMDDREISDYIIQQAQTYDIKEIGFDAYNAASLVARLHDAGLPVKKVGQGMAVLSNPSKHVEKLLMNYNVKHDGNPFVGWQLGNCEVYEDVNGNIKIRKNEADKAAKVDGIISLIIAMHCSLDNATVGGFGFRTF